MHVSSDVVEAHGNLDSQFIYLLQAQSLHYKDLGVGASLRKVVMTDNFGALFKVNILHMSCLITFYQSSVAVMP